MLDRHVSRWAPHGGQLLGVYDGINGVNLRNFEFDRPDHDSAFVCHRRTP